MANNRIYYAIQQVQIGKSDGVMEVLHGLQSVGITTNFNLEQVFELGQLAIYDNIETIPDIEVTLNKVLDGYPLIYTLATEKGSSLAPGATGVGPSIPERQNARCDMRLAIFDDTRVATSGTSLREVTCNGMYVNSVSYTFPVDGNFTEDVTLVGNNKLWSNINVNGAFPNNNDKPSGTNTVGRRQFLDIDNCRFPSQIPGINASGVNTKISVGSGYNTHFQNITVSCDFGREAINELGTLVPYHRYVTFPVEVTSEFEIIAVSGDSINATESGYYTGSPLVGGTATVANGSETFCTSRFNLLDQQVFLQTCEGTRISLGKKNKLSSVNYSGGDTGGGNVSVTYSYITYNDFIVAHSGGLFYSSVTSA